MFRASALSIVLTLAAGPDAALLCNSWCVQADASTECHHEAAVTSSIAAAGDCCGGLVLDVGAFLVKDVRRDASSPDGDHVISGLRHQFAISATNSLPGHDPGRHGSLDKRPLLTILRI